MNDETIKAIVDEVATALVGARIGKIFQLSRLILAIDFRIRDGRYLLLGADAHPGPRLYLIARRVRELEKQALPPGSFIMTLHKRLAGAHLVAMEKDYGDRIVRFSFSAKDITGQVQNHTLIAQLTGRAANLLLLDQKGHVIDSLRPLRVQVPERAIRYTPPVSFCVRLSGEPLLQQGSFSSLSEAADDYYRKVEAEQRFASRVAVARARMKKEIGQRVKLRNHLETDLETHGDANAHKRLGDLLLANIGTAERRGKIVTLTDYYEESTPRIELEIDENASLQEEAARCFARYTKARRASVEIARRLGELESELESRSFKQRELEEIIQAKDENALESFFEVKKKTRLNPERRAKASTSIAGARRYQSSDGFEILVGRASRDNDHLTFRIARPNDLWLHAADYPGSHVIVLNPTRKEIPHRTVIEAAQLAAKFSQARRNGKVDVNYTQRKFLAKPNGAAPGLVRMSSFKTIIVEPRDDAERI